MYMIIACVCLCTLTKTYTDVYMYVCACVRMRFHVDCVYSITRRCSLACVNTCASTYVCNAVSESSFRVFGRGHAWRESVCRAHVSLRVPSLHRALYLRCPPSWASSFDYCAAERDNAALECVSLTQAIITAITYYGPADTCKATVRDACACLAS
jgi:hypothetical protein